MLHWGVFWDGAFNWLAMVLITLNVLLGATAEGISDEGMMGMWEVSGNYIDLIYRKVVKERMGIG